MAAKLPYVLLGICMIPAGALADDSLDSLGHISLENLGDVVTSVSKRPEDSFRAAAAVYVITNEDIKLSGATHVAEVLRGVPGLDVAQIDANDWAISSRGFNGEFSDKLLVLVDGRTIYTPLFAGVYWDIQNMPLEDIERIEVIRGPGAALWGANAVNGVINIITKSAADTQGAYLNQIDGNQARSLTDVRYGGKTDDDVYYRAYAMNDLRAATPTSTGESGNNEWDTGKAGFRADWSVAGDRKVTFQGDAYAADENLNLAIPDVNSPTLVDAYRDVYHSTGANLLGRVQQQQSQDVQSTLQAYIDYQASNYSVFQQAISTLDADYQTNWKYNAANDVAWGLGGRYIYADMTGSSTIALADSHATQQIYNAFLQDQIALIQKSLYLTLGSKFEENTFAGFVPEPSVRLAWYPDNQQTVWGAVSHAVRTPSIVERDFLLNVQAVPGAVLQEQYNHNFASEELTAYELGYRIKPVSKVSIDSTAYVNEYSKLETFEPGAPQLGGTVYPYTAYNLGSGHSYGFETTATWDVTPTWNLKANYSYINLLLNQNTSQDPTFLAQEGEVPHHQFMVRSQLFLPHDVQFVNAAYYVDGLPAYAIDSYLRLDSQLIWQPEKGLELALVGQNLLQSKHEEFAPSLDSPQNEIPLCLLCASDHPLLNRQIRNLMMFRFPTTRWLLPLLTLLATPILIGAGQEITPEEVKASYILKLYPFVLMGTPPHLIDRIRYFEKADVPVEESVGQLVARYLHAHAGGGTMVSAKRYQAVGNFSGCDVLYIGEDEEANIDGILAKIGSAPILTISSVKRFIYRGGMIEFVTDDDNRVKMAGNLHNMKASRVTVDAQVLEVMQQVITP